MDVLLRFGCLFFLIVLILQIEYSLCWLVVGRLHVIRSSGRKTRIVNQE
jgi:hypothetical protein